MSLLIHTLIVQSNVNPRSAGLVADARALGVSAVTQIEIADLYFLEGELTEADRQRLATEVLTDPIAQTAHWRSVPRDGVGAFIGHVIEVALRPGVTDPVAEQIVHGAQMLGIANVRRAASGQRFVLSGALNTNDLHTLAKRLLANPVIQRYTLGEIEPAFPQEAAASDRVEMIELRELDDDELLAVSRARRAALNLSEMQTIQSYYRVIGRDPSDVEFETIAQTWSEHCVHKTFKAKIVVQQSVSSDQHPVVSDQSIDGILKTYIRAATEQINAPWVRSAFVDNAGIIDFDDEYELSFKVETHNHPSAIEPFGGANTGVGGVIRDVLGVSAKPIAATDVLCFGPQDVDARSLPEGVLHPRRIRAGVVAGIQDYGNKIGVPTVNGAIIYDEGYTANPLVFCGCVGIAPKDSHPREPQVGDRVVVLGGRTGRDGLRGATFSSMTMDAQTGEVAGASVQIGDPITEKGLIEVITRARDARLYHAITDCGAGGFSSAVGEMAKQIGAEVDLAHVKLKYTGLAPWEIWLSEAQERMVLAVPAANVAVLQKLCDTFNVELTDIGAFTGTGSLIVRHGERRVLELVNAFLHEGLPQRTLTAKIPTPKSQTPNPNDQTPNSNDQLPNSKFKDHLLALLAHPNIASKADVIRVYDHEVQGGTVVKPLTGALNDGPSDACVLKPLGTRGVRGIVLSCGLNVALGKRDPYRMAWSAIDEAIRNAVAVGADPERIALLDNFCWGDPNRPETLGGLVEAARGCHDAALHYRTPFISGKDSLNNEYVGPDGKRRAIPATLLISAIGLIEDVNQAATMDLKAAGNLVYFVSANDIQSPQADAPRALYAALHRAMQAGWVQACHDLSEGGLGVAAAEMCIGGRLGMELDSVDVATLFDEVDGSLLVEVRPADAMHFAEMLPHALRIGRVTNTAHLQLGDSVVVSMEEMLQAWNRSA